MLLAKLHIHILAIPKCLAGVWSDVNCFPVPIICNYLYHIEWNTPHGEYVFGTTVDWFWFLHYYIIVRSIIKIFISAICESSIVSQVIFWMLPQCYIHRSRVAAVTKLLTHIVALIVSNGFSKLSPCYVISIIGDSLYIYHSSKLLHSSHLTLSNIFNAQ